MLRYFTALLLLTASSTFLHAQVGSKMMTRKKGSASSSANYLDLTLTMGIPMEEFGETTSSLPFGLTVNYLYQPTSKLPFLFGGGIAYLSAGSKNIKKTLTADITLGNTLIDQLNIPLEFSIRNQIINGHALVRVQGRHTTVKPYLDLIGGFNYFWTSTTLYDRSTQNYFQTDDNDRIFHKTQISDIAWSGGAGVGLMVRVSSAVLINLSANYLVGGKLDYYDKNQIGLWNIELNSSALAQTSNDDKFGSGDIDVNAIPKTSISTMLFANAGICFSMDSNNARPGAKKSLTKKPNARKPAGGRR